MNLKDITKDLDIFVEKRIEYIFNSFKKVFPYVKYDERPTIVGIGEPNKYLLCYFRRTEDNTVLVKFKANEKPVTLFDDISNIDTYIQKTIVMFQENNCFKKTKVKEKSFSNDVLNLERDEENTYFSLIEKVVPKRGWISLVDVASNRLSNALKNAGIMTINDLLQWSCVDLLSIKNFGAVCYNELKDLLMILNNDALLEKKVKENCDFLFYKATKSRVMKYSKNKDVKIYLMLINYDENYFKKGTVGRALCLRHKLDEVKPTFSESVKQLKSLYVEGKSMFSTLVDKTQVILLYFLEEISKNERNKNIVASLLNQNKKKITMEQIGNRYGIMSGRVRQIFYRELTKIAYGLNLNSEEGILRYNLRNDFLGDFSICSIDAFLLYLRVEKLCWLEKAFRRVILKKISYPEFVDDNISIVYDSLLKEETMDHKTLDRELINLNNHVFKTVVKYKGFEIILNDDGDVLTDVELLDKLNKKRDELARGYGVPSYMIYHNKQLVLLATYKPKSKKKYISLSNFTEKTWDDYGTIMVEIIKNHLHESSKTT